MRTRKEQSLIYTAKQRSLSQQSKDFAKVNRHELAEYIKTVRMQGLALSTYQESWKPARRSGNLHAYRVWHSWYVRRSAFETLLGEQLLNWRNRSALVRNHKKTVSPMINIGTH